MKKFLLSILSIVMFFILCIPLNLTVIGASDKKSSTVTITKQPVSITVARNQEATVSVKASGVNLKYTWYYKDTSMSAFKKTTVFKGNTYSVEMNASRNGRKVYCVVTDKYGKSAKSKTATIKMGTDLKITKQPVSCYALSDETVKITLKASGDGLNYTWYYKDTGMPSFKKTSTFKSNYYSLQMNESRHGREIYCVVTDKYGQSVKSDTVTLKIEKELQILSQPVSVSAYEGETVTVALEASGNGLTYEWYYKDKNMTAFKQTNTFTDNCYTIEMNESINGRAIYCLISDEDGNSIGSDIVSLKIKNDLEITKQPVSTSASDGKTASVHVRAKGDGLNYEWYYKDTDMEEFVLSESTGYKYSVNMNHVISGRQVYCVITDEYGTSLQTETVTLSIKKPNNTRCAECLKKLNGTSFDSSVLYTQKDKIDVMPISFETVFQISEKDIDTSTMHKVHRDKDYTETVIFSNDDTFERSICISVTENGNPKIGLRHADWYRRSYVFLFDQINVFSDKPVHMAITIDYTNLKVNCYINGVLGQSVNITNNPVKVPISPVCNYAIGGDLYSGNPNYFRGQIYSFAMWSDLRSDAEIEADFSSVIDTNDVALLSSYDLTLCEKCMKNDASLNSNHLVKEKIWLDKKDVEAPDEYDYSFAVIGDTQELSEDAPETMNALYEWIVNNKQEQKIEYVLGLGDITQNSYAEEWAHAKEQIYKLNGNIPYLLSRGNHDYDTIEEDVVTAGFNKTFDDGIYNNQLTGVMTEGDVTNAYREINICGIDYLFITLDFGPNAEMLQWADSVIEKYPEHRVIIITHGYLYRDGTTLDKDDAYPASKSPIRDRKEEQEEKPSLDGDQIWEQFASKHQNIQLVLSGHDPTHHVVYRQDKGDNGNTVTQMLIDPQGIDGFTGATALVAMFYFSDNGNTLTVRYYSVVKDMYVSERSQFTISLS